MHLRIPVGPRRRTRLALLAAALPAALAAFALPAAAEAASVSAGSRSLNVLDRSFFVGGSIENNDVTVTVRGDSFVVTDTAGITTEHQGSGGTCVRTSAVEARCPLSNVNNVAVQVAGGGDKVEYRLPHEGFVDLGDGADTLFAGTRESAGFAIKPVTYVAGSGSDVITYGKASQGVSVTPEDGLANDGRPGDQENVRPDFEGIFGSNFGDSPLFGTPGPDTMMGLGGRDIVAGGGADDVFLTSVGDGADDYHGGPGRDTIDYAGRTQPLTVFLDNVADDGETNEHDNVRSNVENVIGGSARDTLHSLDAFSRLDGRGGDDLLFGENGPDTLIGGPGVDLLDAGSGNDAVDARDNGVDDIFCGSESDTLSRDTFESRVSGCETVQVGTLRLTPKALRAEAGETARLRLSWRHPRAWRKLHSIELRLTQDGAPVGEITIRPLGERISADGAVQLVRNASRLTRKGKTVTARLAIRFSESLAGQTLRAEVEATDTRGRRQLERSAGTIRVAG
jgi:Ca2+-binding RTX toxin-like protein